MDTLPCHGPRCCVLGPWEQWPLELGTESAVVFVRLMCLSASSRTTAASSKTFLPGPLQLFDVKALDLQGWALRPVDETVSPSRVLRITAHGRRGCRRPMGPGAAGGSALRAPVLCLQMQLQQGVVAVSGTLAYVSQQAWIFHGSVRENILFGAKYDHQR